MDVETRRKYAVMLRENVLLQEILDRLQVGAKSAALTSRFDDDRGRLVGAIEYRTIDTIRTMIQSALEAPEDEDA